MASSPVNAVSADAADLFGHGEGRIIELRGTEEFDVVDPTRDQLRQVSPSLEVESHRFTSTW